jgi:hypothetical protein
MQRMSAKTLVDVKTHLEKQLDAAKALLAGVKIGVGELLIVQPDGDCTDADVNALRRQMGPIDGKVVVVRHVNAWRAVPIPRETATKVEEPQQVDPSDFIDGPQKPQFDEQRLLQSQELAQVKRDREILEEELACVRKLYEEVTRERDCFARDLHKLNAELKNSRKIIDANTLIEANDDGFERRETDPGEWNDITISLSSRLIHGNKRAQPAATVMNRDTSPNGPTAGHLQALADLLLQTLERKYPLLATWGAKDVATPQPIIVNESIEETLVGVEGSPMRMADGSTKPFEQVKGGDLVWGDRRVYAIGKFEDGRINIRVAAKGELDE